MPRLANRHANVEPVTFGFGGGVNLTRPGEDIGFDEMQECINFEYEQKTGALRVRGGTERVFGFPSPVTDLIHTADGNIMLARAGDTIYRLRLNTLTMTDIGTVEGGKRASSELWGEDGLVMAFGRRLYLYDGNTLSGPVESENAPDGVEIVFVNSGRVAVAGTGSDRLRFSGVGDAECWIEDTDDDSTSRFIEIGYKDGCGIRAVVPAMGDVLIFKCPEGLPELGRIYRLQGIPGEWAVSEHARGTSAWNPNSAAVIGNDVVFLTREGAANLAAVTEYGDFKLQWAGAKVNPALAEILSPECALRNLAGMGQTWVLDGSPGVWCCFYGVGNAWTALRFPAAVADVIAVGGEAYLAMGDGIYHMSAAYKTDSGAPKGASLKTGTIMRRNQILLKRIILKFDSDAAAEVRLRIEGTAADYLLKRARRERIAAIDEKIAFLDDEPLVFPDAAAVTRHRCNIRRWEITPEIVVTDGEFRASYFEIEVAEV